MKDVKIGIQLYAFRFEFAENPKKTLEDIKAMGYTGVEFPMGSITSLNEGLTDKPASYFKELLEEVGLECYGILTSWADVQPDKLSATIEYNKALESPFLVIGSVPQAEVKTLEDAKKAIDYMLEVQRIINAEGIDTGYHNHDSDFFNVIEGKTFFEHVFDNTPKDFVMLLDTGNAHAGGANSAELLRKYPGRSPYLHIKGYSQEKKYHAFVGKDDYDWNELIDLAVNVGKAKIFDIEFGSRADYDPYERAKWSRDVVYDILSKM